ncbi:MAG: hypothetical protein C4520_06525 [Candidatus Abyssobacteria bacterium SURF_5]|uniref:Uncharacterized protein n=1 Tax=Abyssobacteria bacterium (strain SURF_5) TaxID=2093360 RepID=A0A3A4NRW0_ABYX5|nr:MAG: hypothetical protein C4520_06525 [Candidatus Abyssubacteria bacterium SURF_5]
MKGIKGILPQLRRAAKKRTEIETIELKKEKMETGGDEGNGVIYFEVAGKLPAPVRQKGE